MDLQETAKKEESIFHKNLVQKQTIIDEYEGVIKDSKEKMLRQEESISRLEK